MSVIRFFGYNRGTPLSRSCRRPESPQVRCRWASWGVPFSNVSHGYPFPRFQCAKILSTSNWGFSCGSTSWGLSGCMRTLSLSAEGFNTKGRVISTWTMFWGFHMRRELELESILSHQLLYLDWSKASCTKLRQWASFVYSSLSNCQDTHTCCTFLYKGLFAWLSVSTLWRALTSMRSASNGLIPKSSDTTELYANLVDGRNISQFACLYLLEHLRWFWSILLITSEVLSGCVFRKDDTFRRMPQNFISSCHNFLKNFGALSDISASGRHVEENCEKGLCHLQHAVPRFTNCEVYLAWDPVNSCHDCIMSSSRCREGHNKISCTNPYRRVGSLKGVGLLSFIPALSFCCWHTAYPSQCARMSRYLCFHWYVFKLPNILGNAKCPASTSSCTIRRISPSGGVGRHTFPLYQSIVLSYKFESQELNASSFFLVFRPYIVEPLEYCTKC